ncbi:MAG: dTDP-4-dehydrorhamnose 3,5-epimerase family protein [Candidatus Roizmanbacteria bacterium]
MDRLNEKIYIPTSDKLIGNNIYKTSIEGLYYIPIQSHQDDRGFFRTISLIPDLNTTLNIHFTVKQINHARSNQNVTRGIHAENWNKLVTIISGKALCILADVRPHSPTYKNVEYFKLGIGNDVDQASLFITKNIGNSVSVLEGPVDYLYAVDQLYSERDTTGDKAISLFDQELNIQWPIPRDQMIISERDKNSTTLKELKNKT